MQKLLINLAAETTEIEFKEKVELKKPKSWLKTVSAFSNGIWGLKHHITMRNENYNCITRNTGDKVWGQNYRIFENK